MNNDLIRRSDVLALTGINPEDVMKIPAVEAIPAEPDWQLYTKMIGDNPETARPIAYRYGPSWQATALFMDGGYKTPEEAKLAWLKYWEETRG